MCLTLDFAQGILRTKALAFLSVGAERLVTVTTHVEL